MIAEVLCDKRAVFSGLLLLFVVFVDRFFLRTVFSELDMLEHFLFGFVLSQLTSTFMRATGLTKQLLRRSNKRINASQADLLVRLLGISGHRRCLVGRQ